MPSQEVFICDLGYEVSCRKKLRVPENRIILRLLSRRSRQQERLHVTGLSICSSVCSFVCLSVVKIQKRDFFKN